MNYEIENINPMICSNIENVNNFYVFEIKIITSDNMNIYRKISYNLYKYYHHYLLRL